MEPSIQKEEYPCHVKPKQRLSHGPKLNRWGGKPDVTRKLMGRAKTIPKRGNQQ